VKISSCGIVMQKNKKDEMNDINKSDIKEGIIDKIQEIFESSKIKLELVTCPHHGKALKDLQFDRVNGRFKFETCCDQGNKLVQSAIEKL